MTERREALESLLTHPGWLIVVEEARKDWAVQREAMMDKASGDVDDVRALNKLRQVRAATVAVEHILSLPEQLLKKEKAQESAKELSGIVMGRTPIHPDLVGQGRRGSL